MNQSKPQYLIGDVASMMGVSRDTLRYYEKRGIISSVKGENGYRYYTDDDILYLVSISFRRKMNIGLKDIESLRSGDNIYQPLSQLARQRLLEEQTAIRKHEQTIARLLLTSRDCDQIKHELNQLSVCPFPSAYVLRSQLSMTDSLKEWFRISNHCPGMDMVYIYDEYSFGQQHGEIHLQFEGASLFLYKELEHYIDFWEETPLFAETEPVSCLHTILMSQTRMLEDSQISDLIVKAADQGLTPGNRVYSTYTLHGSKDGKPAYYLELYLPLAQSR